MAKLIKRVPKKKRAVPKRSPLKDTLNALRKGLAKRKKDELIDVIVDLAKNNPKTMQMLQAKFDIKTAVQDLVTQTQRAISEATEFDERDTGHNFDFDYGAYETTCDNLTLIVKNKDFKSAMELALELMKRGSYQLECSDEGMMFDEIEKCLMVVIKALSRSGVEPKKIDQWSHEMLASDRIGCVCDQELKELISDL